LEQAGGTAETFTKAACKVIHGQAGGIPRLVNQLCDLCMVYAFANGQTTIDAETVHQVLEDGVFFAGGVKSEALRLVDPVSGSS
jgi:hypothetical protein